MALSLTEVIALRRLASVYRRILLLAVPVALAGCQDGGDALAPDAADAAAELSAPVAESPAAENLLAAADLSRIAFSSYVSPGSANLWAMSPTGTSQTQLTSLAGSEIRPVWSFDHSRIAFGWGRNTLSLKRLTTDSHDDTQPGWSPDGAKLAFTSNRSGKPQIYTMNSSTGGSVVKITAKTYGADHPSWYR